MIKLNKKEKQIIYIITLFLLASCLIVPLVSIFIKLLTLNSQYIQGEINYLSMVVIFSLIAFIAFIFHKNKQLNYIIIILIACFFAFEDWFEVLEIERNLHVFLRVETDFSSVPMVFRFSHIILYQICFISLFFIVIFFYNIVMKTFEVRKENINANEAKFKNAVMQIKKQYRIADILLLVFKGLHILYLIIPLMCILLKIHVQNDNLIKLDIIYCLSMFILFIIFIALGKYKIQRNFIFYAGFIVFIFFVEVMQNKLFYNIIFGSGGEKVTIAQKFPYETMMIVFYIQIIIFAITYFIIMGVEKNYKIFFMSMSNKKNTEII